MKSTMMSFLLHLRSLNKHASYHNFGQYAQLLKCPKFEVLSKGRLICEDPRASKQASIDEAELIGNTSHPK